MAEADIVKEGFLCPVCHRDLRSPNSLIAHFQDQHSEEQDVLKFIKEFYGKAKKKILKLDERDLELFKTEINLEKYSLEFSEPQEPGQYRSHTVYFKNIRRDRLDHRTTETNKLIIRLDKLLKFYGHDRKQQEQGLVAWLDGSTVTRCPDCASTFNLTRRQHHCRLCGSIMCNQCSYFLSYNVAQTIVAPIHTVDERENVQGREAESLRICHHCLDMLEVRRKNQVEKLMQPIICQLYTHLQKLKSQIQDSVDLYLKMCDSLNLGETHYQLQDTQSLRSTIAKQAETIDTLSKKISSLPVDDTKAALLQNNIRRSTSHYIKDYLLTLPSPPTLEELKNIQSERSFLRNKQEDNNNIIQKVKKIAVTTGWSPSNITTDIIQENDDPLIEQINIVKNYIEQALQANRMDEVASLKDNLKMLKKNYSKNKQT